VSADKKGEIDKAVEETGKAAEDKGKGATPDAEDLLKKKPVKSG
jgi:hypothetical protein